jgi:hypothetical protein
VSVAGVATETGWEQVGRRPQRVLLLSQSSSLAAVLGHLLHDGDGIGHFGSLGELAEERGLATAGAVVVDVPRDGRAAALAEIRRRYQGPLIVLAAGDGEGDDLPPDGSSTLLVRPFSADDLRDAIAGRALGAPTASAPGVVAGTRRRLAAFGHGWWMERRVRLAGFSVLTAVIFLAAFAFAVRGHCSPGCDVLGVGPTPASAISPASSRDLPGPGPARTPGSTAGARGAPGDGAFRQAISGGQSANSVGVGTPTPTTTGSGTGGGPGSSTPTTRPATTTPSTQPATSATSAPPTTTPTSGTPTSVSLPQTTVT